MALELKPSKLGSKDYWDGVYQEELSNFDQFGDEGEVWFGAESVEKMVEWAVANVPASLRPNVIEIGSGNGTLLVSLVEAGYDPSRAVGIDYSSDAIRLAESVAKNHEFHELGFHLFDFLGGDLNELPGRPADGWDLVMDKGTFDAMALMEKDSNGLSPSHAYPERVASIVKQGGYFLITSCNFTEEELQQEFINEKTDLVYHSRIQHATFEYAGRSGSICSSLAFKKTIVTL